MRDKQRREAEHVAFSDQPPDKHEQQHHGYACDNLGITIGMLVTVSTDVLSHFFFMEWMPTAAAVPAPSRSKTR